MSVVASVHAASVRPGHPRGTDACPVPDFAGVLRTLLAATGGCSAGLSYGGPADGFEAQEPRDGGASPCEAIRGARANACALSMATGRRSEVDAQLPQWPEGCEGVAYAVPLALLGGPRGVAWVCFDVPGAARWIDRAAIDACIASIASTAAVHSAALALGVAASSDALTGLLNRLAFDARLDAALAAGGDAVHAVVIVDLDAFKAVNDSHGHAAGDGLIREAARRLVRAVGDGGFVARLGGDEFGVLLPSVGSRSEALAAARRMLNAFAEEVVLMVGRTGEEVGVLLPGVRASFGVATAPRDGQDARSVMRAADLALYRAKGSGSQVALFDLRLDTAEGASAKSAEALVLGRDLRSALRTDGTQLWWQPYVDMATGAVSGFEALLRWDRPGVGNVEPSDLIPVVEANGLVMPLDMWVLRKACMAAAAWESPLAVSVNLSSVWFGRADVEGLVRDVLRASGLDPARLCLEVTEHTLIVDRAAARERMAAVRDLGVRLALDDFGTGSSSLAYLGQFRFDIVKIDRGFVTSIGERQRSDFLVRSVVSTLRGMGARVCAEGVETPAQLAFLRAEGVDLVQGYLLGKPTPQPAFGRPAAWSASVP